MQAALRRLVMVQQRIAFGKIDTRILNKVGYIEMNSPSDYNALSVDLRANLVKAIKQFQVDPSVKVVVLHSAVKKAFCAGANIKEFVGKTPKDFENNDIFKDLHDTFYSAKKPIIASVNGIALGGGFEIALLCDMIFCSEQAKFGLPELKLGLIPGIGGTQRLAKIIGKMNTMKYILTSEMILAPKAKELGIVCDVFPFDSLKDSVTKIAESIVNKSIHSILAAKQLIKQTENKSLIEGVAYERKLFYPLYGTPGMIQGVQAFTEKRDANLKDK